MISNKDNETKHCWNACCPFYKDSIDGGNETLPLSDVAQGLVKACKNRAGGLLVDHNRKKLENESWHPARECSKKE